MSDWTSTAVGEVRESPDRVLRLFPVAARSVPRDVPGSDPTPSENVQAVDRMGQLLAGRTGPEAEVLDLRRQGLTYEEIAARIGWNERSVRRVIDAVRERMEARKWQ